ncbi:hypothetical protein KKB99_08785 [bacterium]|nr:hypothetical protein [bacterium]MBU1026087.1 hypothetical protein [bacterium]
MIKGGKGGSRTQSGLIFEGRVDLRTLFVGLKGYEYSENSLFFNGKVVAKFYKKYQLYSILSHELGIDWKERISKKLLPDETIYIISNKTLFIIEMKFQEVPGSVDEKLQTCDFKKRQYEKLLAGSGIKVKYVYVLNEWFKKPEYKDVLNYIESVGCHYFFKEIPLLFLGLSEAEK